MDELHPTAARLYEAAERLTKGEIMSQVDVAAFFGVTSQVLNNWEKRGVSKKGVVQACSMKPINMRWLEKGEGPMEITGSLARVAAGLDAEIHFRPSPAPIQPKKTRAARLSVRGEGFPDF